MLAMTEQTITNAGDVIDALGGTLAVAEARNVGASAVSMWRRYGIPGRHQLPILRLAQQRGITIPDEAFAAPDEPDAPGSGGAP